MQNNFEAFISSLGVFTTRNLNRTMSPTHFVHTLQVVKAFKVDTEGRALMLNSICYPKSLYTLINHTTCTCSL